MFQCEYHIAACEYFKFVKYVTQHDVHLHRKGRSLYICSLGTKNTELISDYHLLYAKC